MFSATDTAVVFSTAADWLFRTASCSQSINRKNLYSASYSPEWQRLTTKNTAVS